MLPVSGAEQLKTSDAQWMRPISSAHSAYSRFVSLAPVKTKPSSDSPCSLRGGMNRFHNPAAWALDFSESIVGSGAQRSPVANSCAYSATRGRTSFPMNSRTRSRKWLSRSVREKSTPSLLLGQMHTGSPYGNCFLNLWPARVILSGSARRQPAQLGEKGVGATARIRRPKLGLRKDGRILQAQPDFGESVRRTGVEYDLALSLERPSALAEVFGCHK